MHILATQINTVCVYFWIICQYSPRYIAQILIFQHKNAVNSIHSCDCLKLARTCRCHQNCLLGTRPSVLWLKQYNKSHQSQICQQADSMSQCFEAPAWHSYPKKFKNDVPTFFQINTRVRQSSLESCHQIITRVISSNDHQQEVQESNRNGFYGMAFRVFAKVFALSSSARANRSPAIHNSLLSSSTFSQLRRMRQR